MINSPPHSTLPPSPAAVPDAPGLHPCHDLLPCCSQRLLGHLELYIPGTGRQVAGEVAVGNILPSQL